MRRIGVMGVSRARMAQDGLNAAIRHWREQWCFSEPASELSVQCLDEARHDGSLDVSDHRWLVVRTARGEVACSGAWRELIFGPHAQGCPDDGTSRHLLEQAQRALFSGVLTELGHDDSIAMVEGVPAAVGQPLGCRVLVHAVFGKADLWMLVDATLMNAVLPEAGTVTLADRKAAIRSAKLKLRVHLPLASLSIGELRGLSVGDVLRADAMLIDPVQLKVGEGTVIADGYLARQDGHLAVQLISNDSIGN